MFFLTLTFHFQMRSSCLLKCRASSMRTSSISPSQSARQPQPSARPSSPHTTTPTPQSQRARTFRCVARADMHLERNLMCLFAVLHLQAAGWRAGNDHVRPMRRVVFSLLCCFADLPADSLFSLLQVPSGLCRYDEAAGTGGGVVQLHGLPQARD